MHNKIDRYSPKIFQILVALIFVIAPFYYQPNDGGVGFNLPLNIAAWAAATTLICCALIIIVQRGTISLPKNYLTFLAIPAVIIACGIAADSALPIDWLFRQLYVIGGILFLFGLFQFLPERINIDKILLLVAISMLPHTIIGLFQLYLPGSLAPWFATATYPLPIGVFQQINVNASYLATGLAIILYLISRPIAHQLSIFSKILLIISAGFSVLIIAASGSRVGLLSALAATLIIIVFRRQQLIAKKKLFAVAMLAMLMGGVGSIWTETAGVDSALEKTAALTQGNTASVRMSLYSIAYELVKQKPLAGHGISNFLNVWTQATGRFHEANPEAALLPYITHPHNELVLWLIEGGLISVASILLAIALVLLAIFRCGWQRGPAYFAMLLPITFHTQVELPFFTSATHYFLWLLLTFLVLRHSARTQNLNLSLAAKKLSILTTAMLFLGLQYFFIHTARAHADIMDFARPKQVSQSNLQAALNNLYFKPYAEQLAMRSNLYHSISTKNNKQVGLIANWIESQLVANPRLKLFEDLITAYDYLKNQDKKCLVIANGHYRYPLNRPLESLSSTCLLLSNKHKQK